MKVDFLNSEAELLVQIICILFFFTLTNCSKLVQMVVVVPISHLHTNMWKFLLFISVVDIIIKKCLPLLSVSIDKWQRYFKIIISKIKIGGKKVLLASPPDIWGGERGCIFEGFPGGSDGKDLSVMQETQVRSLGSADSLEKGMATHSSILAWRIPWTEEPGRLQSMGSQRVGHDWATSLSLSCVTNGLINHAYVMELPKTS